MAKWACKWGYLCSHLNRFRFFFVEMKEKSSLKWERAFKNNVFFFFFLHFLLEIPNFCSFRKNNLSLTLFQPTKKKRLFLPTRKENDFCHAKKVLCHFLSYFFSFFTRANCTHDFFWLPLSHSNFCPENLTHFISKSKITFHIFSVTIFSIWLHCDCLPYGHNERKNCSTNERFAVVNSKLCS